MTSFKMHGDVPLSSLEPEDARENSWNVDNSSNCISDEYLVVGSVSVNVNRFVFAIVFYLHIVYHYHSTKNQSYSEVTIRLSILVNRIVMKLSTSIIVFTY